MVVLMAAAGMAWLGAVMVMFAQSRIAKGGYSLEIST
jgi:hypothetical protein